MKLQAAMIVWVAFLAEVALGESDVSSQADCPITQWSDRRLANDALETLSIGKFLFQPGGAGFVDRDGALGIKFGFKRLKPGQLFVGGRRLDGSAAPARAYIYDYDGDFQPLYLVFPTPGCWEINAGLADSTRPLTFVVWVEKIGEGPSSRKDGPEPGWRVTTHWRAPARAANQSAFTASI